MNRRRETRRTRDPSILEISVVIDVPSGYIQWEQENHIVRPGRKFDEIRPVVRLLRDQEEILPGTFTLLKKLWPYLTPSRTFKTPSAMRGGGQVVVAPRGCMVFQAAAFATLVLIIGSRAA